MYMRNNIRDFILYLLCFAGLIFRVELTLRRARIKNAKFDKLLADSRPFAT